MLLHEYTMLLIAKERVEEAVRHAEHRRALRLARAPRRSLRVGLGRAVLRLGHWILGEPSPAHGTAVATPPNA